ncbi:MAG: hypothetical protein Q4D89_09130 [Arachnia propionica]|uniref:hypothetical protein n=1 Tax=Arachnia propionica TaxID=1750 RepID=UPI0027029D5A|nr:hypothetical protein [Arachnia propionica]
MGKYDLGYDEEQANRAINTTKGDAFDQGTGCSQQFNGLVGTQGAPQWGQSELGPLGFQERYLKELGDVKARLDALTEDLTAFATGLQVCQSRLEETEGDIQAGQEALQLSIAPAPSPTPTGPHTLAPVIDPEAPEES